jgi:nucleotide-binding universal stress UspA family protein
MLRLTRICHGPPAIAHRIHRRGGVSSIREGSFTQETAMPSILVPLDFSDVARSALPVAGRLAHERSANIVLLLIGELPETAEQGDELEAQKQRIIDEALGELPGISVRYRSDEMQSPANAIVAAVKAEDVSDVVIADAGHTADSQVARDRVIDEVRSRVTVPITVVRQERRATLA